MKTDETFQIKPSNRVGKDVEPVKVLYVFIG